MPPSEPTMLPYRRHILVCTGHYCAPHGDGKRLHDLLPHLLTRYNLLFGETRVKRGECPCLGVCEKGPIVAVYPEGMWYHNVTPLLLERIVGEHLFRGRALYDHLFYVLEKGTDASGPETSESD